MHLLGPSTASHHHEDFCTYAPQGLPECLTKKGLHFFELVTKIAGSSDSSAKSRMRFEIDEETGMVKLSKYVFEILDSKNTTQQVRDLVREAMDTKQVKKVRALLKLCRPEAQVYQKGVN